jgi:hypothetical protein
MIVPPCVSEGSKSILSLIIHRPYPLLLLSFSGIGPLKTVAGSKN